MAAITDYDTLIAEIVATLANPAIEPKIPRFVQFTEAEINRRLFAIDGEVTATTTTVAGDNTLAFPARFRRLKSLEVGADPTNILRQLSVDDLDALWADATNARPENFAIADGQFKLGPTPDDSYTAKMVYVQGIAGLSPDNTTNWLIDDHPDAYFYGCLGHAEVDGWNDERAAGVLDPLFQRIVSQISQADAIRRKGDFVGEVAGTYF